MPTPFNIEGIATQEAHCWQRTQLIGL